MLPAISKAELPQFLEMSRAGLPEHSSTTVIFTAAYDPEGVFSVQTLAFRYLLESEKALSHQIYWAELTNNDLDAALTRLSLKNKITTLYIFAHGSKLGHLAFGNNNRALLHPKNVIESNIESYLAERVHILMISCFGSLLAQAFQAKLPEAIISATDHEVLLPDYVIFPDQIPALYATIRDGESCHPFKPIYPHGTLAKPDLHAPFPLDLESPILSLSRIAFLTPPYSAEDLSILMVYARMGDAYANRFLASHYLELDQPIEAIHYAKISYAAGMSPKTLIRALISSDSTRKIEGLMLKLIERGDLKNYHSFREKFSPPIELIYELSKAGNLHARSVYIDTICEHEEATYNEDEVMEFVISLFGHPTPPCFSALQSIFRSTNLAPYLERIKPHSETVSEARMALYFHALKTNPAESLTLISTAAKLSDPWAFHICAIGNLKKGNIEYAAILFGGSYEIQWSRDALHNLRSIGHPEVFYQLYIHEKQFSDLEIAATLGHKEAIKLIT